MPDVFVAGYSGVWVPPPGKADSGGYSVGYDVFDRFFLGNPYDQTLYGTEQSFHRMSQEMDRAGIGLFVDVVLNHNGFRDGGTPGFREAGDYPGFVVRLDNDIDGDFHGSFASGDLEGRLAGLIDIAQEKNHVFTRQPAPGSPNPIPYETPKESNRAFYPDRDLPQVEGRYPYNLANPLAGDPTQENATGLLARYLQWLVETQGVDGFRIDATKHMPTWFYTNYYDTTVYNSAKNPIDGSRYTPFSFGENFTGNFDLLNAYVRKDGYGNRDTLDFPLFFALQGVYDSGGFGDMRTIENASYDSSDGLANDGTRGVMFAGSHDTFGAGQFNGFNNMPNAHILTRAGYPLIYYNAKEFGDGRDFPKDGRGDALGNYGDTITSLTKLNKSFIKGAQYTRWIDSDIYIYERLNTSLIGIGDRGDAGYDERTVQTGFASGTVLVEMTGNATSAFIDPSNEIFDTVTVNASGQATIRVPRVKASNGNVHGRAYVVYAPAVPAANLTFTNQTALIAPDADDGRRQAVRRLTPLSVIKDNHIDVKLEVTTTANTPSDNSLIKVNYGQVDVDGSGTRNAAGEFAGFESFPTGNPTVVGNVKTYTASIDATQLPEGYNYIQTVSFLQRPAGSSALYNNVRKVVYLDRVAPTQNLTYPARTGNRDISSTTYEAVVSTDSTVSELHMITASTVGLSDAQVLALCTDANKARHHDRLEWRQVLKGLVNGNMTLTVLAKEESGTYSVARYDNIGVSIPLPELQMGIDTDLTAGGVTFASMPATVDSAALANEIVLRVRTTDIDSEGRDIVFGTDYTVSLQVGDTTYTAVPYDAALLPPVGRLVQNDQNLGDEYDEYRFLWRGYRRGQHTFKASAKIIVPDTPANEAVANVTVPDTVTGPAITLVHPAAAGETLANPAQLLVSGSFGDSASAFAQVFIDIGGRAILLRQYDSGTTGLFSVTKPVGSFATTDLIAADSLPLTNGTFPVRVVASTGPNGSGIVTEVSASYTVTGLTGAPTRTPLVIDGNAEDVLQNSPALAVSAADGGTGDALPADFGPDGTNTELHATVRGDTLFAAVRGDYFGATETNTANVTLVLIDKAFGSAGGVKNVPGDLEDLSDGLRSDISKTEVGLTQALKDQGAGFDIVVGATAPTIIYGYSFGSDSTQGTFTNFQFQPNIAAKYDADVAAVAKAAGTTIAAPNAFEFSIPLSLLGNDPTKFRFAVVSSADFGYGSPNTLPENAADAFNATPNFQFIEALAAFPTGSGVLLNEIGTGTEDRIELVNTTGSAVSLAGWALLLRDSSGYPMDYGFPANASIPANGYLVISDAGGITPPAPAAGILYTGFNISWDESRGGSAALVDASGLGRDFVAWRDVENTAASDLTDVPAGTAFTGTVIGAQATLSQSLGRNATSTDTNAAADWENTSGANASVPTFGAANISTANSRDQFIVY